MINAPNPIGFHCVYYGELKLMSLYQIFVKRVLDVVLSVAALLLMSSVLAAIAMAIKVRMGSPVCFTQERPGRNKESFLLYKFRTMDDKRDNKGNLLNDSSRLTSLGKTLRRLSFDELPQLWNVIKGDMSLVGPRPLLTRYLSYYSEKEQLRFTVLPGITGWAQINGRNKATWDQRLEYDILYAKNWNFLLDLKILFTTFNKVLRSKEVVVDAHSIMLNLDEERSKSQDAKE